MKKVKVLWHEESNWLGLYLPSADGIPQLSIVDKDYWGIFPVQSQPLDDLVNYGWIEIGEL